MHIWMIFGISPELIWGFDDRTVGLMTAGTALGWAIVHGERELSGRGRLRCGGELRLTFINLQRVVVVVRGRGGQLLCGAALFTVIRLQ